MFNFIYVPVIALALVACGESKEKNTDRQVQIDRSTDVIIVTPQPRHTSPHEHNEHRPTPQDRRNSHGPQTNVQAVIVNPPVDVRQHSTTQGFPQTQQSATYACVCNINNYYVYGTCSVYRQGTLAFTGTVNGRYSTHEVYAYSCAANTRGY